jgi:GNAT superfamily N-acetyltransferase
MKRSWAPRISAYMTGESNPRDALPDRVVFVAVDNAIVVGLVAGHRTRRFGCEGELEWISVRPEYRSQGIASGLLLRLAQWVTSVRAKRVCVDVQPDNDLARRFYARHGARNLKPSWMVWDDISLVLSAEDK